ncbi:hypothetical protein CALVIDRAFT_537729 [Calocera viscosa TUFC12733]|uniref:Uncharacterized protein n=1 Tax=Calocera viscosa (strain TUFC12733) TaxID=1330018 RepID=A0A167LJ85_CALVF|nr:hypothetical protein CALVIDRAFT_537729 [Calocera viscosa TUFC12733]
MRLCSTNEDGSKRCIVYLTVSGPALARDLPKKLGMSQGDLFAPIWLTNKGDLGNCSSRSTRRTSPIASPRGSPHTSPKAPSSPRGAHTPARQVSPMDSPTNSPLAARGFTSPPSVHRFRALFPGAPSPSSSSVERVLFPEAPSPTSISLERAASVQPQGWAESALEWPSASGDPTASPDSSSYLNLNQSPSYSGRSPSYSPHSPTPVNSPATAAPPQFIPWRDPGLFYDHVPTNQAVEQLTALLAGSVPFLQEPYKSVSEKEISDAWGSAEFEEGVKRWQTAIGQVEASLAQ